MGLSNGSGNYSSGPLYLLTPRSKDKDGKKTKPHFTADTANAEGNLERLADTYTQVEGDLFRAEIKSRTYNDRVSEEPVIYLRDAEAAYRLPIGCNQAGRGLINRLATLLDSGDFTGLQIDYYENKNGYDTYALKQRGEKVQWKYERADLPAPIEIKHPKTGNVEKRDYSEVDSFFKEIVLQIAAKLGNGTQVAPANDNTAQDDQQTDQAANDEVTGGEQVAEQEAAPAPEPAAPAKTVTKATAPRPAPKVTTNAAAKPATPPADAAKEASKPATTTAARPTAKTTATATATGTRKPPF